MNKDLEGFKNLPGLVPKRKGQTMNDLPFHILRKTIL